MTIATAFAGFPREGLEFLEGLAKDNTREYFDIHRETYQSAVLQPAKDFVVALGEELHARVSPGIRAEPRINGSILRINRDTRFSNDKRPYKEHVDFWFWEGDGPSRERPGLFVRLRPATVTLGAGMHRFEPPALAAFRAAIADDGAGRVLEDAITDATGVRGVTVGGALYKRVPRGVAADHPRADMLRPGALYVSGYRNLRRSVTGPPFVRRPAERLERMAPVERWLSATLSAGE